MSPEQVPANMSGPLIDFKNYAPGDEALIRVQTVQVQTLARLIGNKAELSTAISTPMLKTYEHVWQSTSRPLLY
jgi:hypothetical protein